MVFRYFYWCTSPHPILAPSKTRCINVRRSKTRRTKMVPTDHFHHTTTPTFTPQDLPFVLLSSMLWNHERFCLVQLVDVITEHHEFKLSVFQTTLPRPLWPHDLVHTLLHVLLQKLLGCWTFPSTLSIDVMCHRRGCDTVSWQPGDAYFRRSLLGVDCLASITKTSQKLMEGNSLEHGRILRTAWPFMILSNNTKPEGRSCSSCRLAWLLRHGFTGVFAGSFVGCSTSCVGGCFGVCFVGRFGGAVVAVNVVVTIVVWKIAHATFCSNLVDCCCLSQAVDFNGRFAKVIQFTAVFPSWQQH